MDSFDYQSESEKDYELIIKDWVIVDFVLQELHRYVGQFEAFTM